MSPKKKNLQKEINYRITDGLAPAIDTLHFMRTGSFKWRRVAELIDTDWEHKDFTFEDIIADKNHPEKILEAREQSRIIANAISSLEPLHRYLLIKYFGLDGGALDQGELGEALGVSDTFVSIRLTKAKKLLREKLDELEIFEASKTIEELFPHRKYLGKADKPAVKR